jgi:isoquinoline 1-oxidoreductase beta subunit
VSVEGEIFGAHRAVCALSWGSHCQSRILAQQMEGAMIFGLSAAFDETGSISAPARGAKLISHATRWRLWLMLLSSRLGLFHASTHRPVVGLPSVLLLTPDVWYALSALTVKRLKALPFVGGAARLVTAQSRNSLKAEGTVL